MNSSRREAEITSYRVYPPQSDQVVFVLDSKKFLFILC